MTRASDISFLAIDGGGTHCRFLLLHREARHEIPGGTANVSTDFDAALKVLQAGLSDLAEKSGMTTGALFALPAFVGLAGVTGPAIVARLIAALPLSQVRYADDRPAALKGALGEDDGAIAHCGTGSFFAAQFGGASRLTGGWGSILGDEASAMWVGRHLLSMTLRVTDGVVARSPLSDMVLARFDDAAGIVRFASTAEPKSFGDLAPLVTAADGDGDPLARSIMESAASQVAEEIRALGWQPGQRLCLTGGIGTHYADLLPAEMRAHVTRPDGDPIDGAEALARAYALERAT